MESTETKVSTSNKIPLLELAVFLNSQNTSTTEPILKEKIKKVNVFGEMCGGWVFIHPFWCVEKKCDLRPHLKMYHFDTKKMGSVVMVFWLFERYPVSYIVVLFDRRVFSFINIWPCFFVKKTLKIQFYPTKVTCIKILKKTDFSM